MTSRKPFHFSQQQHLKCFLRTLPPQQLKIALYKLRNVVGTQLEASCKMISYKCYEFSISFKLHKAFGYGRNETEAHINCIQNFLELLIEDDHIFPIIKDVLSNGLSETSETIEKAPTTKPHPVKAQPIFDETLVLDAWPERVDGDRGLGNFGGMETLKGNMGNISAIEQDLSMSASKLDVRDILGNLMDNEEVKKPRGYFHAKTSVVQKENVMGMKDYEAERYMRYKRDSLQSTKGTSLVSTGYMSRDVTAQDERRSVGEDMRRSLGDKAKEKMNEYRKENNYASRSVKESSNEVKRYGSQRERDSCLTARDMRSSRDSNVHEIVARESYRERATHTPMTASSPHRGKSGMESKCECHKHLLEAMNKWERLEKEITKLTEENKTLKDRLIAKHSHQGPEKSIRTGSMTERHSDVPPIPVYLNCQSHRRLTYQPSVGGTSVDKENNSRLNGNTEESMRRKSYERGIYDKEALRIKGFARELRRPSMEESSLRKNILHSYRERSKEGVMTERSSSISGLGVRDSNRDIGSQWSGRAHYYKRKNW